MSDVNRDPIRWERSMTQDKDGQYVSYHDYAVLLDSHDRLRAELAEARRLLDEARKQEPVGVVCHGGNCGELLTWIDWKESPNDMEFGTKLYAAPVPAQPAVPSVKRHKWEDDHCVKCGDADWYAGPECSECKVTSAQHAVPDDGARLSKDWYLRNAEAERDCPADVGAGFSTLPIPAGPTYDGPCMCARDHCQNRTSMPHPTWKCRKESQPAVPDDVAKDAKTVLGMEHGQVLVLRRADTKQSCGIGALFGVGICPYIHRLDGSRIYLGCHAHGDKFTGVFEAVAVPKVEWPDAAILSTTDTEGRKDGKG